MIHLKDLSLSFHTTNGLNFKKTVHDSVHNPFKNRSRVNTFCPFSTNKTHSCFYKNLIKCNKMKFFEILRTQAYTLAVNTLGKFISG